MQARAPHPIMVRPAPGDVKHIMAAPAPPGGKGPAGTTVTATAAPTVAHATDDPPNHTGFPAKTTPPLQYIHCSVKPIKTTILKPVH
jgi:hypothetical protein